MKLRYIGRQGDARYWWRLMNGGTVRALYYVIMKGTPRPVANAVLEEVAHRMDDEGRPRPVRQCACGVDCDWCIGANKARKAFPRATRPPAHDHQVHHECVTCFERRVLLDLPMATCCCGHPYSAHLNAMGCMGCACERLCAARPHGLCDSCLEAVECLG